MDPAFKIWQGPVTAQPEMTSWLTNHPGNGSGAGAPRIGDIVQIADNSGTKSTKWNQMNGAGQDSSVKYADDKSDQCPH